MKHCLVLNGFEFHINDIQVDVNQKSNTEQVLKRLDKCTIKRIIRSADQCKEAVQNNPVLTKLLSEILLTATKALAK